MAQSDIVRVTTGLLNTVNDPVIGAPVAAQGPVASLFAGQLGKWLDLDDSEVLFNSTVGTVFGGRFQYVRLAAAATAVVVGQIVFWDISVADNLYQVTTSEAGSADGAMERAGIVLNNSWSAGNYGIIQIAGPTKVKFRGTLTSTGAAGSRVFAAAVGAGVDNGFADVIDSANPTLFSDVSKMMGRFIGAAIETPTSGGLKTVNVNLVNFRA